MDNFADASTELSHSQRAANALQTDSWLSRLNGDGPKDLQTQSNDKLFQALPTVTIDTSGERSSENDQSQKKPETPQDDTSRMKLSTGDQLEETSEHQRWKFKNNEITVHKNGRVDVHMDGASSMTMRKDKNGRTYTEITDADGGVVTFDERGINQIERNDRRIDVQASFGERKIYGVGIQAQEQSVSDPKIENPFVKNWEDQQRRTDNIYNGAPHQNYQQYDRERYRDYRESYRSYPVVREQTEPNPLLEKDLDKRSGIEMANAINKRNFEEVARIVARYKDKPESIDQVAKTAKDYVGQFSFFVYGKVYPGEKFARVAVWERRTTWDDEGQWHHFQTNSTAEIKEK